MQSENQEKTLRVYEAALLRCDCFHAGGLAAPDRHMRNQPDRHGHGLSFPLDSNTRGRSFCGAWPQRCRSRGAYGRQYVQAAENSSVVQWNFASRRVLWVAASVARLNYSERPAFSP